MPPKPRPRKTSAAPPADVQSEPESQAELRITFDAQSIMFSGADDEAVANAGEANAGEAGGGAQAVEPEPEPEPEVQPELEQDDEARQE